MKAIARAEIRKNLKLKLSISRSQSSWLLGGVFLLAWGASEASCLSQVQLAVKTHDFTDAVRVCRNHAVEGDLQAVYFLGVMSERGDGLPINYAKAAEYYAAAAHGGLPDAMNALGILAEFGRGIPQNDLQATRLFHAAALKGVPEAHYNLAALMIKQDIALHHLMKPEDDLKAPQVLVSSKAPKIMEHLRLAAEQNIVEAQYALGFYLEHGVEDSTYKDEDAIFWYTRAAENHDGRAAFRLAGLYENAINTSQNLKEAAYWYHEAFKYGIVAGARELGRLWQTQAFDEEDISYLRNEGLDHGVTLENMVHLAWYHDAAIAGDAKAAALMANIYLKKWQAQKKHRDLLLTYQMKYIASICGGDDWQSDEFLELPELSLAEDQKIKTVAFDPMTCKQEPQIFPLSNLRPSIKYRSQKD